MALAESAEGRQALLQNASALFHVKKLMLSDDDAVCSDASLLYLSLQEQADGRSSSIALPRAICKLSLQLTGMGGRDAKRCVVNVLMMLAIGYLPCARKICCNI